MWITLGTEQIFTTGSITCKVSNVKGADGRYAYSVVLESGEGKAKERKAIAGGSSRRLAAARERALFALVHTLSA